MPAIRRNYRRSLPWIGAVLLVLSLSALVGLIPPARSLAIRLTQPMTNRLYALGTSVRGAFTRSSDVETLQAETETLRDENQRLQQQLANAQQAEQENATLRQLLDFFENEASDLPRVMARISSRDPFNPSVLVLNVGLRDGIAKNDAVVAQDGVLVAKITDVYATSSRALLLTDRESRVAVSLSGGTPSSKLVRGERGLSLILDQVPQQETVRLGQLVVTSGLEPTVPRGLLVGEVEEIVSEKNDLFQTAILRPIVDFDALSIVAVILPKT